MELKILFCFFLTVILLIKAVCGAGSCPNGKGGHVFSIKVNKKPVVVGIAEDNYYHKSCESETCCYKHCTAHNQHCSVALYDRVNRTCDLFCLTGEASYVKTPGITSLENLNQESTALLMDSIVDDRLLYPIYGGIGGRILHISGTFLAENSYKISLWTSLKTTMLFHWGMHYSPSAGSAFNTAAFVDDSLFPSCYSCQWDDQIDFADFPALEVGSRFEIKLFALSRSEFVIKVGDSYQQSVLYRYAGSLDDVAWLSIVNNAALDIDQLSIC